MVEQPSDALREIYERRAELEYPEPLPPPDERVHRKFFRILEVVQGLQPAASFLDAGCGDGAYLAALGTLPNPPRRIVGADIAERMLATAAATAARAGVSVELVRANLEALPFADAEFELCLSTQVIEHLLDPVAGLHELARVLRPGGTLVITTDSSRNFVSRILNAPHVVAVRLLGWRGRRLKVRFPHADFAPKVFARLVRDAGLDVVHQETFRFHLEFPLDRPLLQRALNRLDAALPAHPFGDLILIVARKPG